MRDPVQLPCNHIGCKDCFKQFFESAESRVCPADNCNELIPVKFNFPTSGQMKRALKHHGDFRQKMSQFFIDVLQRFVFGGSHPPHEEIVDDLMSFIVTKQLPKDKQMGRTKTLSPFDADYIDSSPVIRSFLLQLLLRHNQKVETHLTKFIDNKKPFIQGGHYIEFFLMVVQCLEDSYLTNSRNFDRTTRIKSADKHMTSILSSGPLFNLASSLYQIAKDRLALNTAVDCIIGLLSSGTISQEEDNLLKTSEAFVKSHSREKNLQKYVVRYVAQKYQITAITEWKRSGIFLDLLPEELRNSSASENHDMFLIIHPDYKTMRDALRLAWLSDDYEILASRIIALPRDTTIWYLAFYNLTKLNTSRIKDVSNFEAFLDHHHPWLFKVWTEVKGADYPKLSKGGYRNKAIRDVIVHFRETLIKSTPLPFLDIFHQLATNPKNCGKMFLPTMPHDESVEARNAIANVKWYVCPKGHPYAIGDCGKPMQKSKCDTCGEEIGGASHNFVRGANRDAAPAVDQTKRGHALGEAKVGTPSKTERQIGGLEAAIIRFLLHSSLYHAAQVIPADVVAITTPRLENSIDTFLTDHLELNFTQISGCLGKSEDDVIVLMHQIIAAMRSPPNIRGHWEFSSKESVTKWEVEFVKVCIMPWLKRLDTDLARHRVAVKDDKEEAASVLQDILYEKNPLTTDDTKHDVLNLTQFWTPRENVTVEGIKSKIGAERMKALCPFFNRIYEDELIFRELARLPKLLELTRFVIKKYNRKVEASDANDVTVDKFLGKMNPYDRKILKPLVDTLLEGVEKLKNKLYK